MKNAPKRVGRLAVTMAFAVILLLMFVVPARAPGGGKRWTGGRTIASLQEDDFDRRLLRLQLCYGVRVSASVCTPERRRVCKALLVHELEAAMEKPGSSFRSVLRFRCDDTALERAPADEDGTIALRPNAEVGTIQKALEKNLIYTTANSAQHREAKEACEFLTACKWAMRPNSLSLRKLASCATSSNATHRSLLFHEASNMLFGRAALRRPMVYPQLTEAAGK